MSRAPIDRAAAVRPGEELDVDALSEWLSEAAPELAGPIEVEQFPAGYSNLTYLLRLAEREVVLRRPPVGSEVATAHDMEREHRILSALHPVLGTVPRPLVLCADPAVLGAPFYLMERVEGAIPRGGGAGRSADGLPGIELGPEGRRALSEALVDALAELHGLDVEEHGLADLGRPEDYVERQVAGWTERYRAARTDEVPSVERAADWLAARLGKAAAEGSPGDPPSARRAALVHNDFKLDNLVLDPAEPTRIRAVLDWEMATVGDPLMDLGSSLAYWIEPDDPRELRAAPVPPVSRRPGSLSRAELVERYRAATGLPVPDPVFYFVYGLLKLAGILQQIYVRYVRGATSDPRFAGLHHLVRACGRTAERAIDRGRIDRLGA